MSPRLRNPGTPALDRRGMLVGLASAAGASIASPSSAAAREAAGRSTSEPLLSASASDVIVELLAHHTLHDREILALRFTNAGQDAIGLGPGLIRSLFSHGAPVAAGASSDVCSLAPGHDADLTLSIPVHLDARLLEVEIGLLEMQRSGATIRLRFAPLRADAIGGDANTSVRTDSAASPDSLPACLH